MSWKLDSNKPIYLQLMDTIKTQILSGVYEPGAKLPSIRNLALEASVNPNTMQKAMSELEREGIITNNRTSGYCVASDETIINAFREKKADAAISEFVLSMNNMGFSTDEIRVRLRHFIDNNIDMISN